MSSEHPQRLIEHRGVGGYWHGRLEGRLTGGCVCCWAEGLANKVVKGRKSVGVDLER
jgi:hypothetical protein